MRQLKSAGSTAAADVKRAVDELKRRKRMLDDFEQQLTAECTPAEHAAPFDRFKLEDLLRRRFFYDQSFAIYGGAAGLYDFGPMGSALMSNLLAAWREFFVTADRMLEVDCAVLTPPAVLQASGHIDRFVDHMVRDAETGECFRLDHLLKQFFEGLARTDPNARERCSEMIAKVRAHIE